MAREHNLSIDINAASQSQIITKLEEDSDVSSLLSPITDEDIEPGLVYALRTFTETVEGRAKVEKGDSLILLDDSNNYWWLVKILKNGDVGYMPAEDIEMPFEKLARINKHKNVNLTIPKNNIDDNLSIKQTKIKSKVVIFTSPEYFVCGDDNEDVQVIEEQEQQTQQEEVTNQEDNNETQIVVAEAKELNIQHTASATPTYQKVELTPMKTLILTQTNENDQQNIETDISNVPSDQQNDESVSYKIKLRKQTGIFNYDMKKDNPIDLPSSASKTLDISNSPHEINEMSLMSHLVKTKFFGSSSGKTSPISDEHNKNTIVETSDEKIHNRGKKEKEKKDGIFKNFFKRKKKKDDIPFNSIKPLNNSYDQLQMGSSKQPFQRSPSLKRSQQRTINQTNLNPTYSVLRIYPGQNIQTEFKYKTGLLSPKTTTIALIKQAIHRFKLDDDYWDNYYISIKEINRKERHLMPHDHPLEIFNSIASYYSTPLPSVQRTSILSISSDLSNISNHEAINKLQIQDSQNTVFLYLNGKSKPLKEQITDIHNTFPSTDLSTKPKNIVIKNTFPLTELPTKPSFKENNWVLSNDFGLQNLLAYVRSDLNIERRRSGWHLQDPEEILDQVKSTEIRDDIRSIFENVNNELDKLELELNQIMVDVVRVF
ncbi:6460_t:CDS:2 [Cetraspora pellucida]|uniref:6460_t:CDS:1 n=1 Tax=Cetraspora pellucida TaxID=1433469 RepID=A0A9N9D0I9_9GLOM|nr:6460_t:CDS:2 [Cetraspora pellucida]